MARLTLLLENRRDVFGERLGNALNLRERRGGSEQQGEERNRRTAPDMSPPRVNDRHADPRCRVHDPAPVHDRIQTRLRPRFKN